MKTHIELKRKKISEKIIKAFKDQFGEEPVDFETIWPISCWDTLHTKTRTFSVKLKMATGKVESITEEF